MISILAFVVESFLSIDAKVFVCNGPDMVYTKNLVADWLCCICLG